MRTITETKQIGTINDFISQDQAKIIDNYRYINVDHSWYDNELDYFKEILKILGFTDIKIDFTGFCSQGDGASFTAKFYTGTKDELLHRIDELSEYYSHIPLYDFSEMTFSEEEMEEYTLIVYRTNSHYFHENTVTSDNEDLKDFVRNFSRYIYRELEKQYEYLTSDEAVKETLEINNYEFDSDTLKIY